MLAVLLSIGVFAALMPANVTAENGPAGPRDNSDEAVASCGVPLSESHSSAPCLRREPLIVIGFMGGHIHADNLLHGEARLARDLDRRYPNAVDAMTFANRDEPDALRTVLQLLDTTKDGRLSQGEKSAARIVIFGHSWGASETVHFAKELDKRGIPVLLTVQVDSVEKSGEDDGTIPPNVREAINFYQTEGLLHGRRSIQAVDPKRTTILGSYESTYKTNPVSCVGYGWFARAFMKPHIEIENDDAVWNRIEALIVARSCAPNMAGMVAACTK
jgi:pimeloyl-ACP methyl ester carboxylesterase